MASVFPGTGVCAREMRPARMRLSVRYPWLLCHGFRYKTAVPNTLEDCADYAMLIKVSRANPDAERKYYPAEVQSAEVVPIMGQPDPERICTSIVERSNLSLRMGIRRCTRLTNAFSKKWENHGATMSLWYTFYNFCRIHKSLRVTPAVAAGIADRARGIRDLLAA
jgi:hypothetical protein